MPSGPEHRCIFPVYPLACAAALLVAVCTPLATAEVLSWDGKGDDNFASTAENWDPNQVPTASDDIEVPGGSNDKDKDIYWDEGSNGLPETVASWLQEVDYPGTVTVYTVYGSTGFTTFTVSGDCTIDGGAWGHLDNSTTEAFRLHVAIGGNLTLGAAGKLTADGLGFDRKYGPGAPTGFYDGASHGGMGGDDGNNKIGMGEVYGSWLAPTNLGSGGQEWVPPNDGGGAIKLTVAGMITNHGVITANGVSGPTSGGAASGGSVYITAGGLAGTGRIQANGVQGEPNFAASGGGRVAVILTSPAADFGSYSGRIEAAGGGAVPSVTLPRGGAAGTVYLQTGAEAAGQGTLQIKSAGSNTAQHVVTPIPTGETWTVYSFYAESNGVLGVGDDAVLNLPTTNLSGDATNGVEGIWLHDGGDVVYTPTEMPIDGWTLRLDKTYTFTENVRIGAGGNLTHGDNDTNEMFKVVATINGHLTIDPGGRINVDGLGYKVRFGPGAPTAHYDGAGHGGMGGDDTTANVGMGPTYGSYLAPTNIGSGGREQVGRNDGGGAIALTVLGPVTNNGVITADAIGNPSAGGGGSGGSVYIVADSLFGNGSIGADGEKGQTAMAGGGGGRVAIILTNAAASFTNYTGAITAYGGDTLNIDEDGAAGTVYLETPAQGAGQGTLIIRNDGRDVSQHVTTAIPSNQVWQLYDLQLASSNGVLGLGPGTTLQLGSNSVTGDGPETGIRIYNGGQLALVDNELTVSNWALRVDGSVGTLTGDVTIADGGLLAHSDNSTTEAFVIDLSVVGNLTIASNGSINVDGLGFDVDRGPGTPTAFYDGASHGGEGGDDGGNGTGMGLTYGSYLGPTNIGSGGKEPANPNNGGGAIKLTVSGPVTNHGGITANGLGNINGAGAPSGGSVWIIADSLAGNGAITADGANGQPAYAAGGGGRISIQLTGAGSDFNSYAGVISAFGGDTTAVGEDGAAGTVYLEKANQAGGRGTLIIDNSTNRSATAHTHLPPSTNGIPDELVDAIMVVTNFGILGVQTSTETNKDIFVYSNAAVVLDTNLLYINSREHFLDGFDPNATSRVDNYDQIIWIGAAPGTLVLVR